MFPRMNGTVDSYPLHHLLHRRDIPQRRAKRVKQVIEATMSGSGRCTSARATPCRIRRCLHPGMHPSEHWCRILASYRQHEWSMYSRNRDHIPHPNTRRTPRQSGSCWRMSIFHRLAKVHPAPGLQSVACTPLHRRRDYGLFWCGWGLAIPSLLCRLKTPVAEESRFRYPPHFRHTRASCSRPRGKPALRDDQRNVLRRVLSGICRDGRPQRWHHPTSVVIQFACS